MRKWLVVLLSVGLVLGFALSASAADVKFSGSYYAQGHYTDRPTLKKDIGPSSANYWQRLRVVTDFKVVEGLNLVVRFDALERVWGDHPGAMGATGMWGSGEQDIRFEYSYVDFKTAIGLWRVGYGPTGAFGTVFADSSDFYPQIAWFGQFGPFIPFLKVEKWGENSYGPKSGASGAANTGEPNYADRDYDRYYIGFMYKKAPVDAGVLYRFVRDAGNRPVGVLQETHSLNPYVKADIGPVKVQWEGGWVTGKVKKEIAGQTDTDLEGLGMGLFVDANLGPIAVGGTFGWLQGDDPTTPNKIEGAGIEGGTDYDPTLMMWNFNYNKFAVGNRTGYATGSGLNDMVRNAWLYSLRAEFKPVPKLSLLAWWTYAYADKKPAGFVSDSYGHEFDFTATYKIYDNLSYMAGFGYWVVGDYFKGTKDSNQIANNWILTHKLTFNF